MSRHANLTALALSASMLVVSGQAISASPDDIKQQWQADMQKRREAQEVRRVSGNKPMMCKNNPGDMAGGQIVRYNPTDDGDTQLEINVWLRANQKDTGKQGAIAFVAVNESNGKTYSIIPDMNSFGNQPALSRLLNRGGANVYGKFIESRLDDLKEVWYRGRLGFGTETRVLLGSERAFCSSVGGGSFTLYAGYGVLEQDKIDMLDMRDRVMKENISSVDPSTIQDEKLRIEAEEALKRAADRAQKRASPMTREKLEMHEMYRNALDNGSCWMVLRYDCPAFDASGG